MLTGLLGENPHFWIFLEGMFWCGLWCQCCYFSIVSSLLQANGRQTSCLLAEMFCHYVMQPAYGFGVPSSPTAQCWFLSVGPVSQFYVLFVRCVIWCSCKRPSYAALHIMRLSLRLYSRNIVPGLLNRPIFRGWLAPMPQDWVGFPNVSGQKIGFTEPKFLQAFLALVQPTVSGQPELDFLLQFLKLKCGSFS